MKKLFILLLVFALCLAGCYVNKTEDKYVSDFFAMDTVMNITAYNCSEDAVSKARDEVLRLDELLSVSNLKGDVAAVNLNGGGELSSDSQELLKYALEIYENTDGAFDIALYNLTDLWGFYSDEYNVPAESEIVEALKFAGSDKIHYQDGAITLNDGVKIDLGGIAKGYASDCVAKILRENGVESATVSLGGNIYALGTKSDGKLWNIGIQDPVNPAGYIGVVAVSDMAVVTSGTYQRYFEENGEKYHHILDPKTGKPAESGLCSVSIVCENGTLADGLSTALLVMGLDDAAEFWSRGVYDFDAVLVADNGDIYITSGLEGVFSSNLPYKVIKK